VTIARLFRGRTQA